jgi:DNA-binding Xre family transcriptional regulator
VDYYTLQGSDIERLLVESVVTSGPVEPEGVEEPEEKTDEEKASRGPGRNPALKIFFVRSAVDPDELSNSLHKAAECNSSIAGFLTKYQIKVLRKESNFWALILRWRKFEKELNFLIKVDNSNWQVLTNERMEHVRPSFLKLLEICRELGHLWVERSELEEVVSSIVAEDSVNGFIAKRDTLASPKKVTIRVYGGSSEDLGLAREYFHSEPTQVYFSKANSPEASIVGSVLAAPGCLSVDRILPAAIPLFREINNRMRERFQNAYDSRFVACSDVRPEYYLNEDGLNSIMSQRYRAISIRFDAKVWDEQNIRKHIERLLLAGLANGESQYIGYQWTSENSYVVHDTSIGGMVQLRVDSRNKRIILDALTPMKPRLLGDLAEIISQRIEHTVFIEPLIGG